MFFGVKWNRRNPLFSYVNYVLYIVARIAPDSLVPALHRLRGVKIGQGVFIHKSAHIDEAFPENITIEDDVRIAAGAIVISEMIPPIYLRKNYMPIRIAKVRISRHSFIGLNAVVMPGVTIGEGAVVVSGSVVMTNVAPYTVVMGIPAKRIKDLKKKEEKNEGT